MLEDRIKSTIRDVHDFPKPGIVFKDITPILTDPQLCSDVVLAIADKVKGLEIDAIAGVESRGFLFGLMLANHLNVPFIPIRKKGKLPYATHSFEYDLEYGSAVVEMHTDAVQAGWNVLVHDDMLATGGTAGAAAELIQIGGGKVSGFCFLIGLSFLNGSAKLNGYSQNIINLIEY